MEKFFNQKLTVTNISLIGYVPEGCGNPIHKNRKDYGLVLYVGASCDFVFEDKTCHVGTNEILFLPKRSNYVVKQLLCDGGGCYYINFDLLEDPDLEPFVMPIKNAELFLNLFKQADSVWRAKKPDYDIKCYANLYNIIYAFKKEYNLQYISGQLAEKIEPAISYIHTNYTGDNIEIAYLAEICNMSESYFRRVFKQVKAVSPIAYINQLKLSRAKELLEEGMYSVSDVAFLSGYHDEAYFSREFKRETGISPVKYKEK